MEKSRSQKPEARSQNLIGRSDTAARSAAQAHARAIRASCFWLLGLIFLIRAAQAQVPATEPERFLRQYIHLTDDQISPLKHGQSIARILDSAYPAEITPFGAINVGVRDSFLIEKYRDIATFKKSKEVLQIGKFHSPPQIQDLDALILDQGDIDSLKKCQVGDCALKLPAEAIDQLQREVNRSSPDYAREVTSFFRRFLFNQIQSYAAGGNAALPVYRDKKVAVPLAGEFATILQESTYLTEYAPALAEYLRDFPKAHLEGSEEFFYWSKEKFGYKAVVSLTHVTIYRVSRQEADWTFFASKQIYASHYFQGSLGLAMFVERKGQNASPDGCLIYLNRSRADLPLGFFSGLIRYFVKRRVLDGMEKYLKVIKERLETEYCTRP